MEMQQGEKEKSKSVFPSILTLFCAEEQQMIMKHTTGSQHGFTQKVNSRFVLSPQGSSSPTAPVLTTEHLSPSLCYCITMIYNQNHNPQNT